MAKPNNAASPKGTNVAKMVVMEQGMEAPKAGLDLSYLDNVCETASEGTFNTAEAVEVKSEEAKPEVPAEPAKPENQPESKAEQPAVDPDEIEDPQFKGKSKKEIYESYKELQKLNGRMSNEVGDYRKFFDQFIMNQAKPQQPQSQQVRPTTDDGKLLEMMLGDPNGFVELVERRLMGKIQSIGAISEVGKVYQQNQDLMQDQNFLKWAVENVDQSVRELADRDPKTCNFIFNSYRALHGKQAPAQQQSPQPAATSRNVVVSPAASGTGSPVKVPPKTWTRREVRELYANNPAEYRRRETEITAAYQNGLVVDK